MSSWARIVGGTMLCVLSAGSAAAAWFIHPCRGYRVWYPDDWYLKPDSSEGCGDFSIIDVPLDDPRTTNPRTIIDEGVAAIWLKIQEFDRSCRDLL
ncbi:MAG: hypothetical protein N3C12_00880 [Candidatus Binatia bacterium]|nr:hypothetical protein [Candidatus Binatia bacterium]